MIQPATDLTDPKTDRPITRIGITETYGWRRYDQAAATLWFKGHLAGKEPGKLARALSMATSEDAVEEIAALDGQFALVAQSPNRTLAATDRIGSIPLFFREDADGYMIDSEARRLATDLDPAAIDPEALLTLAMAGYTIGPRTLHRGLEVVSPGEAVLFQDGAGARRKRYYAYRPWTAEAVDSVTLEQNLADVTGAVLEKLVAGLDGRPVMIPLSAGLDSRLIAAGLRHLGYRDVRCYSYGQRGNHEAAAGRRIASALGYDWRFVEHTPEQQRATFSSALCRDYVAFCDTLSAIPFQQDFHAVRTLRDSGYAPADAIFVNGQSGDYLSGNHIPASLCDPAPPRLDEASRWRRIVDALIAKHFSLWAHLKTPGNLAHVAELLQADLVRIGNALGDPCRDFGLFEASEFDNRQSKYVIAGQRCYEFFGFEWRLPLWDRDYLDFWEQAPISAKCRQTLYRRMLWARNWGGVWGPAWEFPHRVRPNWLRPIRMGLKVLHAPVGRDRWHAFERQHLAWVMDPVCNYAIAPYRRVARDRRGHRNAIAWHVEAYLAGMGLELDHASLDAAR